VPKNRIVLILSAYTACVLCSGSLSNPVYASTKKHFYNNGEVLSTVEINDGTANGPLLDNTDYFGVAVANIGDLNNDGVQDLSAGSAFDDNGGTSRGAVHIHFMNKDGSIKSTVEINDSTENGPVLSDADTYGFSIANIGDLNNDGIQDLAVGAQYDDAGGTDRGTVHIHFMNRDGSVKSTVEINDTTANGPDLLDNDFYGRSVSNIGDLDSDGTQDLAVGARGDDNGGSSRGAVHIHFMNKDGSIKSTVEINDSTENGPVLSDTDTYGFSIANIGDLNNDGIQDVAVGGNLDDTGGSNRGTVHIHFMNRDGSVKSTVEINNGTTNGPQLSDLDGYGASVVTLGDLNNDEIQDLAVGATGDDNGGTNRGALHIHFMNRDGSVKSTTEINDSTVNGPVLSDSDAFGISVSDPGDLNDDGIHDIVIGAWYDDNGGTDRGAVHIIFMKPFYTLTFLKDTSCKDREPEETTWIQLEPKDNGMYLTWTQYDSQHVKIRIDDGTGSYPWEIAKSKNDGHEFLPNVASWQKIKLRGVNGCREGDFSEEVSYSSYPSGWYNN